LDQFIARENARQIVPADGKPEAFQKGNGEAAKTIALMTRWTVQNVFWLGLCYLRTRVSFGLTSSEADTKADSSRSPSHHQSSR
jgi:hypothetical protein